MTAGAVEAAAEAALAGALIVFPTDTVYGIGTRPDPPEATARLFRAKARDRDTPLPVLVHSFEAARELAVFDERAERLAAVFWPGALTLILPLDIAGGGRNAGAVIGVVLFGGYVLTAMTPVLVGAIRDLTGSFELSLWLLVAVSALVIPASAPLTRARLGGR